MLICAIFLSSHVIEMGQVSIYLHKSVQDYADKLATAFDTSRSEVIDDVLKFVQEEEIEDKIWGKERIKRLEEYEDRLEEIAEEKAEAAAEAAAAEKAEEE